MTDDDDRLRDLLARHDRRESDPDVYRHNAIYTDYELALLRSALDAALARAEKAEAERDDARGERDAYMGTSETTRLERDALQRRLDAAMRLFPALRTIGATLGPNTASWPADGSYSEFKPPSGYFDEPTQAARVAYWFKSYAECAEFNDAVRDLAALGETGETKKPPEGG